MMVQREETVEGTTKGSLLVILYLALVAREFS